MEWKKIISKEGIPYLTLGVASLVMVLKHILVGQIDKSKVGDKRHKVVNKIKRLFNDKYQYNSKLKYFFRSIKATDNYSKFKDFTGTMMAHSSIKEIQNTKTKQEYIFYQLLGKMDKRLKQKSLKN